MEQPELKPILDVVLGDIVRHHGLFAGQIWHGLITGVEPHEDGSVTFFEVGWPLVQSSTVPARSSYEVVRHSEEDLTRALRMFEGPPPS